MHAVPQTALRSSPSAGPSCSTTTARLTRGWKGFVCLRTPACGGMGQGLQGAALERRVQLGWGRKQVACPCGIHAGTPFFHLGMMRMQRGRQQGTMTDVMMAE